MYPVAGVWASGSGRQTPATGSVFLTAEITETQMQLVLGLEGPNETVPVAADRQVVGSVSRLLVDVIKTSYDRLGFSDQFEDHAFFSWC